MFEYTPEGFEQARAYAEKIGKLKSFDALKDNYVKVYKANQWYNENNS